MKAFLLAAGHGTRLRPLTDTTPKCLLPIRGLPLLEIWLRLCERSGIEEVLINVHAHPQAVQQFVDSRHGAVTVRVAHELELLGSAGTVVAHKDWVRNDESFWILYSDVLTNVDLPSMAAFHADSRSMATLVVTKVPDPQRCGIVKLDEDGLVTDFVEKPERPIGNLAFSGIMMATNAIFADIP